MNKIYFSLVIALVFITTNLNAQVYNVGGPVSFKLKNELKDNFDTHLMPSFDLATQLSEDQYNHTNKIGSCLS